MVEKLEELVTAESERISQSDVIKRYNQDTERIITHWEENYSDKHFTVVTPRYMQHIFQGLQESHTPFSYERKEKNGELSTVVVTPEDFMYANECIERLYSGAQKEASDVDKAVLSRCFSIVADEIKDHRFSSDELRAATYAAVMGSLDNLFNLKAVREMESLSEKNGWRIKGVTSNTLSNFIVGDGSQELGGHKK